MKTAFYIIIGSITYFKCECRDHLDGHGKPFGSGGTSTHVEIVTAPVLGKEFFESYVGAQKALLLKGIYSSAPALKRWTDEYFTRLRPQPYNHVVLIESRKKENRTAPATFMSLKQFVAIYRGTEQYMVDTVPKYLWHDVQIPGPLQCKQLLTTALVETYMWFSGGGTKSVIHTDAVENLNCLVDGRKRFVFIPPTYKNLDLIDHPEGAYSSVDVDAVDYDKFPRLAQVEFMHADMEAGDCLYIPFKWIHQVNSFGRNIAVNFWWDTFKNKELNLNECNVKFDPTFTLLGSSPLGFDHLDKSPSLIRDHVMEILENGPLDFDGFVKSLSITILHDEEFKKDEKYKYALLELKHAFALLDIDMDGLVDKADSNFLDTSQWEQVTEYFKNVSELAYPGNEEELDNRDEL